MPIFYALLVFAVSTAPLYDDHLGPWRSGEDRCLQKHLNNKVCAWRFFYYESDENRAPLYCDPSKPD
jgi:hypothetical protein